ncbi:MAG: UvrB/UvrC motif-containing protein [Planctomycetota bacterium]
MKCQYCEKPATFHITELTGEGGPQVLHVCEQHAKNVLNDEKPSTIASVAGALAKQLQLGQTKEELKELDQKACPVCGITFFEFRNSGRLGCPMDYTHFESDLEPLLLNIHDSLQHIGKRPRRAAATADSQGELIALRKEMDEAVRREEYEAASVLRDRIAEMQNQVAPNPATPASDTASETAGEGGEDS